MLVWICLLSCVACLEVSADPNIRNFRALQGIGSVDDLSDLGVDVLADAPLADSNVEVKGDGILRLDDTVENFGAGNQIPSIAVEQAEYALQEHEADLSSAVETAADTEVKAGDALIDVADAPVAENGVSLIELDAMPSQITGEEDPQVLSEANDGQTALPEGNGALAESVEVDQTDEGAEVVMSESSGPVAETEAVVSDNNAQLLPLDTAVEGAPVQTEGVELANEDVGKPSSDDLAAEEAPVQKVDTEAPADPVEIQGLDEQHPEEAASQKFTDQPEAEEPIENELAHDQESQGDERSVDGEDAEKQKSMESEHQERPKNDLIADEKRPVNAVGGEGSINGREADQLEPTDLLEEAPVHDQIAAGQQLEDSLVAAEPADGKDVVQQPGEPVPGETSAGSQPLEEADVHSDEGEDTAPQATDAEGATGDEADDDTGTQGETFADEPYSDDVKGDSRSFSSWMSDEMLRMIDYFDVKMGGRVRAFLGWE